MANSDLFTSSPTWAAMLADPNGPAAGAKLTFDANSIYPWKQNREERQTMEEAWSKQFPPSKYGYQRTEVQVTMRDGVSIPVKIYRPEKTSSDKPLPLVFNTHGGGWYQGSTLTEEIFLMRAIMISFEFVIVSPEYRLAPEHPFPTALDDCWDTFLWTLKNEELLAFDRQNVLLAASSAGGSLTSAIAVRVGNAIAGDFGDEVSPELVDFQTKKTRVKGVVLNVPITCHPDFLPDKYPNTSYAEAVSGTTLLCSEEMHKIWALYAAPSGKYSGANPEISPLLADLRNFPPSWIYIAGQDPVRDEAVAFGQKLKEAGRNVEVVMYPGVPHVFGAFDDLMETKKLWQDCKIGIESLLNLE